MLIIIASIIVIGAFLLIQDDIRRRVSDMTKWVQTKVYDNHKEIMEEMRENHNEVLTEIRESKEKG